MTTFYRRGPVKVIEIIRTPQNVPNRPVRSLQPLGPIQNNSDLAQGPLPIRPSKVRRKLPHVAAELIGWESSDAQDHRVFRCRRFVRDWVRSMGGLARQSACFPLDRSGD